MIIGLVGGLVLVFSTMARAGDLPKVGEAAPDFSLPDQNGVVHNLKEFSGKWLVLYFYPKDDTPGCTQEACAFRDDLHKLDAMGAQVVGISVDDGKSHAEFAKKYHLPFPLLADSNKEVAARYGVLMDIVFVKVAKRYTFLVDPQGNINKIYDKVETSHHSQEIIDDLNKLTTAAKT